jgi:hypothetical protein
MSSAPNPALLDDPAAASRAAGALADGLMKTFGRYCAGAATSTKARGYLLIDPTLRNALDDPELAELLTATNAEYCPVPRRHPSLRADQQPLLIAPRWDLPEIRALVRYVARLCIEDLQPDSYASGGGQRIGGWLFSGAPVTMVANHLAALMVQQLPADFPEQGGKRYLLRVQDALVLSGIWEIATPVQAGTILGLIDAWCNLSTNLRLCELTHLQRPTRFDGNIDFSVEQWRDILSLEFIHREALLSQRLFAMEEQRPAWIEAMRRAPNWGLTDKDDLRLFAHHAITIHPSFDSHPRVRAALRLRQSEGYGGATETLSDSDWHAVATEMTAFDTAKAPTA